MSKSKTTRSCAFGLRIVSPDSEEWHWFAAFAVLARDLALRLYDASHHLDGSNKGPRVPFTFADADGLCMTWLPEAPYQAEHTHYGVPSGAFAPSGKPTRPLDATAARCRSTRS